MIKRTKDPRTPEQKKRDAEVLAAIEAGTFSQLTPEELRTLKETAGRKKEKRRHG